MRKKVGYYCVDVNPKKTKSLGIYNVTKKILEQLLNINDFEITVILSKESEEFFREFKCKKNICYSNKSYLVKKLFIYPSFANMVAKKGELEILFFPKGHIPFTKNKGIKYFSFIHDLIPIYYLKKGDFQMIFSSFLLYWSAKFSDFIFTNSNYSRNQIKSITKKPIEVLPLGYNKVSIRKPSLKKNSYVFIIGNKNPHKNLKKSIELLEEYNKFYNKKYNYFISSGKFSDEELAGYYKNAKFSMFLSDIEGFGLPLIESYTYETPVIFNNKTSLAEIGRGLPGGCNINNKQLVFKAMQEVESLKRKEILFIKRKLLRKYNWGKCREKIEKYLLKFS